MKFTLLLLFVFAIRTSPAQSLKPGESLPDIRLSQVRSSGPREVDLAALKGKVVLLDFWATWCTPCIQSFAKLGALQEKFNGSLQIIAVSDEAPDRLLRFLNNRPVNFWVASDTSRALQRWFPHVSIPHVVLIDAEGVVRAVTYSDEINEQVLNTVMKGATPAVSFKNDKTEGDAAFAAVPSGTSYFGIKGYQAEIRGGKSMTGNSLLYSNMHFSRFFLDAYDMNHSRLRYEGVDPAERSNRPENRYSLYLAIPQNDFALVKKTLRQKLNEEFVYKARIGREKDTVFVLTRIAAPDSALIRPANSTPASGSNKGKFFARNQPVGVALAQYLEGFGIVDGIVVDETGDRIPADIQFTWEPEQPGAVEEFLRKLGLKMEQAVRTYDVLILHK